MQDYEDDDELEIDLVEIYNLLRKNVGNIARVTGACIVLGGLYLAVAAPTYESVALLRVKQPQGLASSLLDSMPMGNSMASKQLMSTYAEILKSRSVVVPVIEATEEKSDSKYFGLVKLAPEEQKYPRYDDYMKSNRIKTDPFKDTEIMSVSFKAKTAEDAQKGNQLLVNGFLKRLTDLTRDQQRTTRIFLESRVKDAKKELSQAEDKVNAFQKENKILAPDAEVKMAAEKLALTDKMKAENQVAAATGNARAAASAGQLQGSGQRIADNSVIKDFNKQLTALEAKKIEYASKYTAKHPAMVKINQDIADMQKKLDEAIHNVANGQAASDNPVYNGVLAEQMKGEVEANIAQNNLEALKKVEAQYKEDLEELSDTQRNYLGLLRDRTVAEEIYVMLSKRLEEAKVAEVSVATEVQVVDSPTLPEKPVAPIKRNVLAIAALIGLLFSSGFVVVRGILNRTIKTADDVEKYLGLPVLGQIPDYNSLQKRMAADKESVGFWTKLKGVLWK